MSSESAGGRILPVDCHDFNLKFLKQHSSSVYFRRTNQPILPAVHVTLQISYKIVLMMGILGAIFIAVFVLFGMHVQSLPRRSDWITRHSPVNVSTTSSINGGLPELWEDLLRDIFTRLPLPMLRYDARETNTTFEIHCDLPGVEKKDISISLKNNNMLTISANRKTQTKDEGATFSTVERQRGEISRTINLPENIDKAKIDAEIKDGVLRITAPKLRIEKENISKFNIDVK